MSRHPFLSMLAAAAVSAVLCGCDYVKPPPAQLESVLTLDDRAGDYSDARRLRSLADNIVTYLNIAGISVSNTRVVFDASSKRHTFEVYGKEAIPQALLDQVAKALAGLDRDRFFTATVEVAPLDHLDDLLGSKERNFPVRASWKDAAIDVYIVRTPESGLLGAAADLLGERERAPITAYCVLSFLPAPALPKLTGSADEYFGKPQENDPYSTARRFARPGQTFSAPYTIKFDAPELSEALKVEPVVQDGKLAFQYAVLDDANVIDIAGSSTAPMDVNGATREKCLLNLSQDYPALGKIFGSVALLEDVKAFGQARKIALKVPAK